MINVPTHKKVTNAVQKNKKCCITVVKHLQFPVGKILRREFARTCFSETKERGSSPTDVKKSEN